MWKLYARLLSPKTWMLINCGNANAAYGMEGHPMLSMAEVALDLEPYFEVSRLEECLYDMHFSDIEDAVPEWNRKYQAVLGWCAWVRLKPSGSALPADIADASVPDHALDHALDHVPSWHEGAARRPEKRKAKGRRRRKAGKERLKDET